MKLAIFILALGFAIGAKAQDSTRPHNAKPWDYIKMTHGKLIEVTKGVQTPVTGNIVLVNESTIHPNGTINASSGRTLHLKEGQYITMDGRIRKLKNLPKGLPSR